MKRLIILITFVFLSGFVFSKNDSKKYSIESPVLKNADLLNWIRMIGRWYGSSINKENEKQEWLVERFENGTFSIQFQITRTDGTIERQVEKGEWGISGKIYFTLLKKIVFDDGEEFVVDQSDPYNKDAYFILKLTEKEMVYKHARNGVVEKSIRVNNSFQLQKAIEL